MNEKTDKRTDSSMQAKIYQPAKSAMQSGRAGSGQWVLEYETTTKRAPEPLMGWTGSGDTLNQVRLRFDTQAEAETFAEAKGLQYTILPPHARRMTPRSYLDNFKPPPHVETGPKDA